MEWGCKWTSFPQFIKRPNQQNEGNEYYGYIFDFIVHVMKVTFIEDLQQLKKMNSTRKNRSVGFCYYIKQKVYEDNNAFNRNIL